MKKSVFKLYSPSHKSIVCVFLALLATLASAFSAYAVDPLYTMPRPQSPSPNSEIPSCIGVDQLVINVPGGGDLGIESIDRTGLNVNITLDGEPYMKINSSNTDAIKFSPSSINEFIVNCGKLTEPGKYTVTLPKGLVKMAIDNSSVSSDQSEEEDLPIYYSAELTYSFTIVALPEYSITPKPGLYQPSELNQFTLAFPEGSEISMSSANSFYLYNVDLKKSSTASAVVSYSATISGNKVIFTCTNTSKIEPLNNGLSLTWDYFTVPRGALTIKLNGETYSNPVLNFEKYDVRVSGATGFSISPSSADGLLPVDVRNFVIQYPAGKNLESNVKVGSVIASLKQVGVGDESKNKYSGIIFGDMVVTEIDTENRQIKLMMQEPESDLSYYNNPKNMETGYYALSIYPRTFSGISTLNFTGYGVVGKEGCMVSEARLYYNNTLYDELDLPKGSAFNGIELYFPLDVKVLNSSNVISLKKNGETVWSSTASAAGFKSSYEKYYNIKMNLQKTAGEYILNIPAGTVMQNGYGDYPNLEQNIKIIIRGTVDVDEIECAEDVNEPTSYYTLDGLKVDSNNLAKGIYIKKTGVKTEKILVK